MAKAETIPVVSYEGATLTLSMEEVKFLRAILTKVGGSPTNSPRKHSAAIENALDNAFQQDKWEWERWTKPEFSLMSGDGIDFADYERPQE